MIDLPLSKSAVAGVSQKYMTTSDHPQDLQGNRPIIGRIFDQLVRTLPDGVYFTGLKRTGQVIEVVGAAESNNRVSSLMRNLDASEWLIAPNLTEVKAVTAGAIDQANTFQLSVRQETPGVELAAEVGQQNAVNNNGGKKP